MITRFVGWLACAGAVVLLVVAMITGTVPVAAAVVGARVSAASVRLPIVPGRPAAGYFTLTAGSAPAELTGVTSPLARVELHTMTMSGGVMQMHRLPSVQVAAKQTVRFATGGSHLMLFDVDVRVHAGTTMPLTFQFADGTRVVVAATVQAGAEPAMMPMSMSHGAH